MCNTSETDTIQFAVKLKSKDHVFTLDATDNDGNPTTTVKLSDGTTLEITHMIRNLRSYNTYYTLRHICNDADKAAQTYRNTANAKASFSWPHHSGMEGCLSWYLSKIATDDPDLHIVE